MSHRYNQLYDFLTDIKMTTNAEETWKKTLGFFSEMGASHVCLHHEIIGASSQVKHTAPDWAFDSWLEEVGYENDPIFQQGLDDASPFFSGEGLDIPEAATEYLEWWKQLDCLDIQTSVDFSTRFDNNSHGSIGVFFDHSSAEFMRYFSDYGNTLHLAGLSAMEHYRSQWKSEPKLESKLTARERDCLRWLATGLRNEQIANRLGIKVVTVEFHIQNARRKLKAKTREQALVLAFNYGLLEL